MADDGPLIALDAMGGDNAPLEIVAGAVSAATDLGVRVALVGDPAAIEAQLSKNGSRPASRDDRAGRERDRDGRVACAGGAAQEGLVDRRRAADGEEGRGGGVRLGREHRRGDGGEHHVPRADPRHRAAVARRAAAAVGQADGAARRGGERGLRGIVPAAVGADGVGVHGEGLEADEPDGRAAEHRRGGREGLARWRRRRTSCSRRAT